MTVMVMGAICVGVFLCAFGSLLIGPDCSDPPPSSKTVNLVSDRDINQVIIHSSWSGLPGDNVYTYTITKIDPNLPIENPKVFGGAEFIANVRGERIKREGGYARSVEEFQRAVDNDQIANLNKSLVNLRESWAMRTCNSHTDDYPWAEIEIAYSSGQKVVLLSSSNCPQRKPWNVVAENKVYVQYTGEIPRAYYALIGASYSDEPDYFDFSYKYEYPLLGAPEGIAGIDYGMSPIKCLQYSIP